MNATLVMPTQSENHNADTKIKKTINSMIDELMASLPELSSLTSAERHGIIARYSAVLEGNFIYWMTATLLAVKSEEARPILLENLHEEVRDAHPAMLRRFALAAHAYPTDTEMLAMHEDVTKMRLFLGRLSGVQSLAAMAFFEGFIQKFMAYLAALAAAEGSTEMEYTDVHGVCDIEHTDGLFRALALESVVNPLDPKEDILEGATLLRNTMKSAIFGPVVVLTA
ncbi:MAG TPA: iron-containing redox enzyme family protein [Acidobacteriaceae bacterium]|nr:iron-containing redox enzyme family protein [Acidobacteriaceae bacterium]